MREIRFTILAVIVVTILGGCAARPGGEPEPRPLGREYETFRAPPTPARAEPRASHREEPTGVIRLEDALASALLSNPELAAFSWEIRAAEARALQAGLRPNPEIGVEVEEFGGTGELHSLDAAVITPRLSQDIELGGKRGKRKRVAGLEIELTRWDYESKRLDVLTEVRKAFAKVLVAQERLLLAEELVRLSEQTYQAVSERVEAGKVSPLEEAKASVTRSTSRIEHERAQRDLAVFRKRLTATWGSTSVTFQQVEGRLDRLAPIPSREEVISRVSQNPEIARWSVETELRHAAVEMEKAGRIPDLTLSGGVQHFSETDDHAYVVEISMPFPFFDRNQGSVREAESGLAKAREEQRSVEVDVSAALAEAYETLAAAYSEATALRDIVRPAAEKAFDAAREGYRLGKLGYLDLLDAQRTYFEVKGHWIDAVSAYHEAVADVERLVGESISGAPEIIQETR